MTRVHVTPAPAKPSAHKPAGATASVVGPPLTIPAFSLAQIGAAPAQAVIQARWVDGPGPDEVHWVGRSDEEHRTDPPAGKTVVDVPLATGAEAPRASGHHSMRSLYTQPDAPTLGLDTLIHAAANVEEGRGLAYTGPTEVRGIGPQPVLAQVPRRDPGLHRTIFNQNAGVPSANQYNAGLGLQRPGINYQIGHGVGHGQGGAGTQQIGNLATISQGANGEMIPFDDAISGNPEVIVDTSFNMRAGTHRAESVHQTFAHRDYPDEPFHDRMIDGDRPLPSSSQWDSMQAQAARYAPANLDAAVTLRHLAAGPAAPPTATATATASASAAAPAHDDDATLDDGAAMLLGLSRPHPQPRAMAAASDDDAEMLLGLGRPQAWPQPRPPGDDPPPGRDHDEMEPERDDDA